MTLAAMMIVRPEVRAALIQREFDFGPLLEEISIPVLVSHSRADTMLRPAMSEYILSCCKTATPSWYADIGHAPFLEEPERFNRELAAFARGALAGSDG